MTNWFHTANGYLILRLLCEAFFLPSNYFSFIWQGTGWKIVASFEGRFPDRMKQLPLDRHFDINNVKRVSFQLPICRWHYALSWVFLGLVALADRCLLSDCVRSWWVSTISHFPWKGIKIINQRCSRACERAIASLCWWGIYFLYAEWIWIMFYFFHSF